MRRLLLVLSVASVFAASACGSSNPASPSPASGSGAVINGSVYASGASTGTMAEGGPQADPLTAGMTVSVAGTGLSAPVDGEGRFSLRGVPDGMARLRFSSANVDATADLPSVESDETITITVSVTSTSATIEAISRSAGNSEQLEGRIEALPPTTAAGALIVAGRTVTTDAETRILSGNMTLDFTALAVGQRVHVKGTSSDTSLVAGVIDIQNTNVDIPVPINGIIQGFTGDATAFTFTIGDRTIQGDAATEFFGNSEFSDIADGLRAEVKGLLRNGFVYADRMKVETEDDDGGSDESASIEGLLESVGSLPTPLLVVAGTNVTTTTSTVVRRRGDVQDLSVLVAGMTVHVVGARQTDGSIVARMIQIKDDASGGTFQIEGPAGGVSGTCPALAFKVNGFTIATDAATTFSPAPGCSAIKSGTKVKVTGTVQANGSVLATTVERQ